MWRGWVAACCVLVAVDARALEVISVTAGPTTEPGHYTMDARVVVDARPLAVREVLIHLCEYKELTENLSYCRDFRQEGPKRWSYSVVDLPVLDPRDYVILAVMEQDLAADGTGTYRNCWDVVPGEGPPPRPGVLRLATNHGCWTMTPSHGGQKTAIHYEIKVAPGGVIPANAAGFVVRRTLPDYMRLLERLGKDMEKRSFPPPDPVNPWATVVLPLDVPLPPPRKGFSLFPRP